VTGLDPSNTGGSSGEEGNQPNRARASGDEALAERLIGTQRELRDQLSKLARTRGSTRRRPLARDPAPDARHPPGT
jgi:hypothetical protein